MPPKETAQSTVEARSCGSCRLTTLIDTMTQDAWELLDDDVLHTARHAVSYTTLVTLRTYYGIHKMESPDNAFSECISLGHAWLSF